jgi:hypothetical protein
MDPRIQSLFNALDHHLVPVAHGRRLELYLLGRSAMIVRHGLNLATKDVDFLWRHSDLEEAALERYGEGTPGAAAMDLYLQRVSTGLPPVPSGFERRSQEVQGDWQVLRVFVPDPHDLAATKLKRFEPRDRQDIQWLADQGLQRVTQYLQGEIDSL